MTDRQDTPTRLQNHVKQDTPARQTWPFIGRSEAVETTSWNISQCAYGEPRKEVWL